MGRYDEDDGSRDLKVYDDRADELAEEEADYGHGSFEINDSEPDDRGEDRG